MSGGKGAQREAFTGGHAFKEEKSYQLAGARKIRASRTVEGGDNPFVGHHV